MTPFYKVESHCVIPSLNLGFAGSVLENHEIIFSQSPESLYKAVIEIVYKLHMRFKIFQIRKS